MAFGNEKIDPDSDSDSDSDGDPDIHGRQGRFFNNNDG